jgi:hypothetical protein
MRDSIRRSLLRLVDDFFHHGGQVAIYDANVCPCSSGCSRRRRLQFG